ncbi:MAG TPA: hypothetical protein VJ867_12985 [Gemmatimonadaceae bacterium]|nr:hypothetical protein [Gemmatimonadaceae bacterium]
MNGRFPDWAPREPRENPVVNGPRVLRDAMTGELTTVVERKADGVAGARASHCLLFHTDRGFTRLWVYPQNWADLSDEDLLRLEARQNRSEGRDSRSA